MVDTHKVYEYIMQGLNKDKALSILNNLFAMVSSDIYG